MRLVREGQLTAGFVTAGNTGATMATAKVVLGTSARRRSSRARRRISDRHPSGRDLLFDVGANVDCTAQNLEQFAVIGNIYCRSIFGMQHPRVGLLSIGEEEGKGNDLTPRGLSTAEAPSHQLRGQR